MTWAKFKTEALDWLAIGIIIGLSFGLVLGLEKWITAIMP